MSTATETSRNEIVISREFNAPRDLVWDVWTEAAHIEKWWGPEGFSTRVNSMDFLVGGKLDYVMIGPDGAEYPGVGVFKEIQPKERIVSTDDFGEDFVNANPEMDLPQGIVTTAAFDDLGGRTRLTLTIAHPTAEDMKKHEDMGVVAGWNSSLDCLADYLTKQRS